MLVPFWIDAFIKLRTSCILLAKKTKKKRKKKKKKEKEKRSYINISLILILILIFKITWIFFLYVLYLKKKKKRRSDVCYPRSQLISCPINQSIEFTWKVSPFFLEIYQRFICRYVFLTLSQLFGWWSKILWSIICGKIF